MKKQLLKNLLNKLTNSDDKTLEAFKAFDSGTEKLKSDLKEKIQASTIEDVNSKLDSFQKRIDFTPLSDSVNTLKDSFFGELGNLTTQLDQKFADIASLNEEKERADEANKEALALQAVELQTQIFEIITEKNKQLDKLREEFVNADSEFAEQTASDIATLSLNLLEVEKEIFTNKNASDLGIENNTQELEKLRRELIRKIDEKGGGSMNRQIYIGGVDPLTRYTDINLKAGSNVTITYANNNTTKKVDITIAATGGGGGGGIVRSVNTVAISTAAGSTAGTDYVYLASGTITITLPTSVGNSNLYTIKNIGAGTVTVNTTGGETIDGGLTVTMPVQFTSVDLISNNSGNWDVT